jgi:ribosomal protein L13
VGDIAEVWVVGVGWGRLASNIADGLLSLKKAIYEKYLLSFGF